VSSESRRALAFVASSIVHAGSSVLADLLLASIIFVLTTDTRVIRRTTAVQAGTEVLALATMHTRISNAAFWGSFAVLAIRATGTHAEVVLEQVNATGVVLARSLRSTSGHLLFAAHSTPTRFTATLKATDAIPTESIVQAGLCLAVIDIGGAQRSLESIAADALKLVVQVEAAFRAHGIARVTQALVDLSLAGETHITRSALAAESV